MTLVQTAPSDPIFQLWRIARVWLADAVHAFGAPPAIARELARDVRRALTRRLKALEILLMKLLLVQAAALPARVAHASGQGVRPHIARGVHVGDPDQTETWRVRFMLRVPPEPRLEVRVVEGPRIRRLGPPLLVREAFTARAEHALCVRMAALSAARFNPDPARERAKAEKLARRFEALRRAMANPQHYARRLKRRLAALAHGAYDAATLIAFRRPPLSRLYDSAVDRRASFESGAVVAKAVAPPALTDST